MSDFKLYETKGERSKKLSKERNLEVGKGAYESNALVRLLGKIFENREPKGPSPGVGSGRNQGSSNLENQLRTAGVPSSYWSQAGEALEGVPLGERVSVAKQLVGVQPEEYGAFVKSLGY